VDVKNEAESFVYTTEKLLTQDLKDKLTQEQGIKISDAVKELKEVLDKGTDEIRPKLDALKTLVNQVTTELYKNASPPPNPEQQQGQSEQSNQSTGTTS
jgi:molecular chaperone DnaK